jgi:cytoskeletal protein CcmA (bactofilin family)
MLFNNKKANKIEAFIGAETEIEGSIRTGDTIRIDGKVKGGIQAEAVIIGEHGHILGDITASRVVLGGKVKGNISAASVLELLPKAVLVGDIRTSKLIISDGANFEGNCQMLKSDGQIIEMNPNGEEDEDRHQKHLKVVANGSKH